MHIDLSEKWQSKLKIGIEKTPFESQLENQTNTEKK